MRFEVDAPAELSVDDCNCSMCARTGYLHLIVTADRFRITQGADALTTYTFNTGTAKHLFCATCGIKPFYVPRSHPDGFSVNARCIDSDTVTGMKSTPSTAATGRSTTRRGAASSVAYYQLLRSSRSFTNTVRASGFSPISGNRLAQPRDDLRVLQPQERIHALLFAKRRDARGRRLLRARRRQRLRGIGIARLAIEREREIARHVLMPGIHARGIRQPRELIHESLVEQAGIAAVVAVAGAGVEQRVAAEQRG